MNHPAYKSNKVFYMLHLIETMIVDLGTFQIILYNNIIEF